MTMKIAASSGKPSRKVDLIIPLADDEEHHKLTKENSLTWEPRTIPTSNTSPTYILIHNGGAPFVCVLSVIDCWVVLGRSGSLPYTHQLLAFFVRFKTCQSRWLAVGKQQKRK